VTKEQINRLADFLVEDIMVMTDQEVLLEDTETAAKFAAIIVDNPSYQLSPEFHGDRLSLAKWFISLRAQIKADGEAIARLDDALDKNLQSECCIADNSVPCGPFTEMQLERDAALARVAELEAALWPFGRGIHGKPFDALTVCNQDDLRRAFVAIHPADKGEAK
jgi:hypothetical protein